MPDFKLEIDTGGIANALRALAEQEPGAVEQVTTAAEELQSFENEFGANFEEQKRLRAEGQRVNLPAAAAGEHSLSLTNINDLRAKFLALDVIGLKDSRCHMLPIPTFDEKSAKLVMKVVAIDPASKIKHRDIQASLVSVYEMAAFINADNSRLERYGRVYELLREAAAYMDNDVLSHPKAEYDSGVDLEKVIELLDEVPFGDSSSLVDYCYAHIYDKPEMAAVLKNLMAGDLKRDQFRAWVESITPEDDFLTDFASRFKKNVRKKVREYVMRFESKFKNGLGERVQTPEQIVIATAVAAATLAETAMKMADAETAMSEPIIPTLRASAPRPEYAHLPATKIVSVGQPALASTPLTAEGKLAKEFADFIGSLEKRGVKFSFICLTQICELIFGDSIIWIRGNEVDINELRNAGFRDLFPDGDEGYYLFEDFSVQIYCWKKDLESKMMLNDEVRGKFMKALRNVNK